MEHTIPVGGVFNGSVIAKHGLVWFVVKRMGTIAFIFIFCQKIDGIAQEMKCGVHVHQKQNEEKRRRRMLVSWLCCKARQGCVLYATRYTFLLDLEEFVRGRSAHQCILWWGFQSKLHDYMSSATLTYNTKALMASLYLFYSGNVGQQSGFIAIHLGNNFCALK